MRLISFSTVVSLVCVIDYVIYRKGFYAEIF